MNNEDFCLEHNNPDVLQWFENVGEEETYRQVVLNNGVLPDWNEKFQTINYSEAKQYLASIIPSEGYKYESIRSIITSLPVGAQAAFWKDTFYFKDQITKGELAEEAFHSIISTIFDDGQRQQFYNEGAKLIPDLVAKTREYQKLYPETYNLLSNREALERVIEETVAEKFRNYYVNKSEQSGISKFFDDLFQMIKEFFGFGDRNYIDALFADILKGKYRNSNVVFSENTTASTYLIVGKNSSGASQLLSESESEQVLRNLVGTYFDIKQQTTGTREELVNYTIEAAREIYSSRDQVIAAAFVKDSEYFDTESLSFKTETNPNYSDLISEFVKRIEAVEPLMFDAIEEDQGDFVTDENADSEYAGISDFNSADEAGFESISGWLKQYIKTVGVPVETISLKNGLEVTWREAVDESKIYYGVARALNNSRNDFERLVKLINYGTLTNNSAANALLKKVVSDVTGKKEVEVQSIIDNIQNDYLTVYDQTKDASIINNYLNGERSYILQNLLKGFDLWSRKNMFQSVSPETGNTYSSDANINNAVATQVAKWQQNSLTIDSTDKNLSGLKTSVATVGDFGVRLNETVDNNVRVLRNIAGITVSPDTMKWLLMNTAFTTTKKLPVSKIDQVRYKVFSDNIKTFASEVEISSLLELIKTNGNDPKALFEVARSRVDLLARINGVFDESVWESSYTDAEGKKRYGFQWKTFDLEFAKNFQDNEFLSSLMNNGLVSYRTDSQGNKIYLKEGSDFLHNNIFLKDMFKQENGRYVLKEGGLNELRPYFQLISVDGIRQTDDKKTRLTRIAEINEKFKTTTDRLEVAELAIEKSELEDQNGVDGEGVSFSNMPTKDFDLYRMNFVVNESITVLGKTLYPHYLGNLEAKRTADFMYLPELKGVYNNGITQSGIDYLKEEVRKEYDRIRRVHKQLKEAVENNELIKWNDNGEGKLTSTVLRDQIGDVYEKYHTGQVIREQNEDSSYVYRFQGVRALEFSDSVKGILPKEYMKQELTQHALNDENLDSVWNNNLLTEHWDSIFSEHLNAVRSNIPFLDKRWKNGDQLNIEKFNQFVLSSFINTLSFNQLMHGDPALVYKNDGADMYKRFGGRNAAIQSAETFLTNPSLGITEVKQTLRYVTANEMESLIAYDPFNEEGKKNKIDQGDAQNYATTEYKRYLLWSRGKLTKFLAKALDDIELGIPLTAKQREVMNSNAEYFNVDKTVAFNGVQYLKKSDLMLTKELTSMLTEEAEQLLKSMDTYDPRAIEIRQDEKNWIARPDFEFHHNLRQNMEGWRRNPEGDLVEDRSKRYDLYMPISASKMLNINVFDPQTGWDNIDGSVMEIAAKNYGLQLENPAGKSRIIDPSQMIEIIFNEQEGSVKVLYKGEEKAITSLESLYQDYLTRRDKVNFDLAFDEIIDSNGEFDKEAFFPKAVDSLIRSGADPQTVKIFSEKENGKYIYNPNIGVTKQKFTDILFAHFTKGVLQQKVAGDAKAHASSYGVTPLKRIVKVQIGDKVDYTWEVVKRDSNDYNKIARQKNYVKLDLENSVKDGIIYDPTIENDKLREKLARLYESGKFYFTDELRHLKPRYQFTDYGTDTNGGVFNKASHIVSYHSETLMPATKVDQQYIDNSNKYSFGVRIPSQDKHSAVNVEWVDLMPLYYGNTIITAKEIVALSGSDFDIDKLFIHKPELYKLGNKYVQYGTGDKWVEYLEFLKDKYPQFKKRYSEFRRELLTRDPEFDNYYNTLRDELATLRQNNINDERIPVLEKEVNTLYDKYVIQNDYIKESLKKPVALLKEMRLPTNAETFDNPYALNNEILQLKQIALTNDGTLKDIDGRKAIYKTSATMDVLKNADSDPLFLDENGNSVFAQEDIMSNHIFVKHSTVHKKNSVGKQNINPYVNGNLGLIMALRGKFKINPDYQFTINEHTATQFQIISSDGRRVFDDLSALISAATDEAKEQLNAKYNLNLNGAEIVKTMIALGFTVRTSLAYVNHPTVQQYLSDLDATQANIIDPNAPRPQKPDLNSTGSIVEYGDIELTNALKGDYDAEVASAVRVNLDTIIKISEQLAHMTRFLKVKKGFSGGLNQLDNLNESVDVLDVYGRREKFDMPIDTNKMMSVDMKKRMPQVYQVIEYILPKVNNLVEKLLIDRTPEVVNLNNAVISNFRNLSSKNTESILKDISTYLNVRLYFDEDVNTDLLTNNLFRKGEDHATVAETFLALKKEVNSLIDKTDLTADEKILKNLAGTSIFKRLTVKTKNDVDELKLDTFAKLSIEEQDNLITSVGEMIKNLRYLSDDKAEYKSLPAQLFSYWIVKDGFYNKYGSIAKLFPVYMFKDHSNSLDKALAGTSEQFNKLNTGELYDTYLRDILERLATNQANTQLFKTLPSSNDGASYDKFHNGDTFNMVEFNKIPGESKQRSIAGYPFNVSFMNNKVVLNDLPMFVKKTSYNESGRPTSSLMRLDTIRTYNNQVLNYNDQGFYEYVRSKPQSVAVFRYVPYETKAILDQSPMTENLNYTNLVLSKIENTIVIPVQQEVLVPTPEPVAKTEQKINPKYELFPGVEANAEQKIAIDKMTDYLKSGSKDFFVLEGKGGVGKTTIIKKVLETVRGSVYVTALSHKAKDVARTAIDNDNYKYESLAKFLGMSLDMETGKFTKNLTLSNSEYTKTPGVEKADVIVVDESSMINEEALQIILSEKKKDAKVIFMGDRGQLPPIRENDDKNQGTISPVFTQYKPESYAQLFQRMRQGEESPILPFADFYWNNSTGENTVENPLPDNLRADIINSKGVLKFITPKKILTDSIDSFRKQLETGNSNLIKGVVYRNDIRERLNKAIRSMLFKNPDIYEVGDILMFQDSYGEFENSEEIIVESVDNKSTEIQGQQLNFFEIITTKTDEYGIPKQETVRILHPDDKPTHQAMVSRLFAEAKAITDRYERGQAYGKAYALKDRFAKIDYAYFITSHKSQGSTYDEVLVYEDDIMGVSKITNKEKSQSMYTAITRARNKVTMVSAKNIDGTTSMATNSFVSLQQLTDNQTDMKKVTVQMQPDNIQKIIAGIKTSTIRSESQANVIGLNIGESGIVKFSNTEFIIINKGLMSISEAGGKDAVVQSEGLQNESEFKYQQTKDWVNGKGKLYVYSIHEAELNNNLPGCSSSVS